MDRRVVLVFLGDHTVFIKPYEIFTTTPYLMDSITQHFIDIRQGTRTDMAQRPHIAEGLATYTGIYDLCTIASTNSSTVVHFQVSSILFYDRFFIIKCIQC
jgi:hypothetical protein